MSFQSDGIHLDLIELVRQDTGLVHVHGGPVAFDRCSDLMSSHPVSLSTDDASLELHFPTSGLFNTTLTSFHTGSEDDIRSMPSIDLTFITNEPSGLIIHSVIAADWFIAFELFQG